MKRKLNSQETVNLCEDYAGKTVLVVNTASYCGYTPQFEGLEALYSDYKDKDFVVLGFPSHDFNQEDNDEGKTAELCELTYGVKFPMFEPTSVKGDDADPMFRMLAKATGKAPSWNFNKYLISPDGKTITHYPGSVKPSEISKANFELLQTLKLDTLLTPGRRNGVFSMLKKIKEYAISYNKN